MYKCIFGISDYINDYYIFDQSAFFHESGIPLVYNILTFEKLEMEIVLHFCLKNY